MSRYDRDPRVQRVSATRYEIPDPKGHDHWVVERHGPNEWRARATHGEYTQPPHWSGKTADEAIALIIGKPQR